MFLKVGFIIYFMGVGVRKGKKYNDALRFIDDLVLELSASRDLQHKKISRSEVFSRVSKNNLNIVYKVAQRTGFFSSKDLANVFIERRKNYLFVSLYANDRAYFSVLKKVVNRLFMEQEYSFDGFYFNDGLVF